MPLFLLALLLLCSSAQSVFAKLYSEKTTGDKKAAPVVFNIYYSLIIAAGSFAIGGFSFNPSWKTLAFASIAAAATTVYNIAIVKAAQSGPYPIYMISALFGAILLPTAIGTAVFGDKLTLTVVAGAVVMLISIALLAGRKESGRLKGVFIRSCVALIISNGAYGTAFVLQSRYVTTELANEDAEFVTFAFGLSAVASLVILFLTMKKDAVGSLRLNLPASIFTLASSGASCAAQRLYLAVLALLPTVIVMPVHNGGVLVIISLFSLLFFKEKLSRLQWIGVALAAVSIVLMNL